MNAFVGQSFQMNQIINLIDVIEFKSINRAKIYEMINQKSKYYDSTFPKKVKITQNRIGWSAWEINQWIEAKLASRE